MCITEPQKNARQFFWFYPLKELFFSRRGPWLSRFPGRWFCRHRNHLSGKVLHSISDGQSINYDHLSGCPDFQRGGSAGRGTTSLGKCCTAFLMGWALIILALALGGFNHLSGKAEPPIWKSDVASEKRSPWPPKKLKWGPPKKAFPRFHLKMYFLQKNASKLVKFGLCSSISDLQTPIGGHHPMLYFPSQIPVSYTHLTLPTIYSV